MRLPFHRFVMLLLLPCLSSAGLADERRHRHERHGGVQPIVRHEVYRHHHNRPPVVRYEAHRRHHHRPHIGSRIVVVSPLYVQPQPVVVLPPIPPPGEYRYYCTNPLGYYPYVAVYNVEWQAVPPGFGAPPPYR